MNTSKDFVIIPAYNEMLNLFRTIDLIKATKIPVRIIVIDDGSFDLTYAVAKLKGCDVLRFPENRGKSAAFFYGIKYARVMGATSVVTIDADMTYVGRLGLERMIGLANFGAEPSMSVTSVEEGGYTFNINSSGIRSFSRAAIEKIDSISKEFKRKVKGYSLEAFLNDFFHMNDYKINLLELSEHFKAKKAYRRPFEQQGSHILDYSGNPRKELIERIRTNTLHEL